MLTACGASRQPLVRTEIVEVPVTQYVPLSEALTDPLPYLAPPPRNCRYRDGKPAVCALDGLLWITSPQAQIDRANEDRATAAKLGNATGLTERDRFGQP